MDLIPTRDLLVTLVEKCNTNINGIFKDNRKMKIRQYGKRSIYVKMITLLEANIQQQPE